MGRFSEFSAYVTDDDITKDMVLQEMNVFARHPYWMHILVNILPFPLGPSIAANRSLVLVKPAEGAGPYSHLKVPRHTTSQMFPTPSTSQSGASTDIGAVPSSQENEHAMTRPLPGQAASSSSGPMHFPSPPPTFATLSGSSAPKAALQPTATQAASGKGKAKAVTQEVDELNEQVEKPAKAKRSRKGKATGADAKEGETNATPKEKKPRKPRTQKADNDGAVSSQKKQAPSTVKKAKPYTSKAMVSEDSGSDAAHTSKAKTAPAVPTPVTASRGPDIGARNSNVSTHSVADALNDAMDINMRISRNAALKELLGIPPMGESPNMGLGWVNGTDKSVCSDGDLNFGDSTEWKVGRHSPLEMASPPAGTPLPLEMPFSPVGTPALPSEGPSSLVEESSSQVDDGPIVMAEETVIQRALDTAMLGLFTFLQTHPVLLKQAGESVLGHYASHVRTNDSLRGDDSVRLFFLEIG